MSSRADVNPSETDLRRSQCCGHVFATHTQRRRHEARVERGERVLCPCGEMCSEGADDGDQ